MRKLLGRALLLPPPSPVRASLVRRSRVNIYNSHYTEASYQAACSFLDQIDIPRLSEQNKEAMNRPVKKSELLQNLKSMNRNDKFPGLDGLPVEFCIVFFHDIAD